MKKKNAGFTLMELMIVVGILSIIAAITVPNLLSSRKRAQEGAAGATIRSINTAETSFMTSNEIVVVGVPHYGTFADLTAGPLTTTVYLDGTWNSVTARGGYVYDLIAPAADYEITATSSDAIQRSFRSDESGSVVGEMGMTPPPDMLSGSPIN